MLSCFATNSKNIELFAPNTLIHIILMFFIWSDNHTFYIQFLRLLGLQSFIITPTFFDIFNNISGIEKISK
jgi:hypothetical protein